MSSGWLSFFSTLAGAFFGAWFAFLFNANRETRRVEDDHVRTGRLALYNLFEYWNALEQYYKEAIHPFLNKDDAWLNMPPVATRFSRTPSLRDLDLSFILGTEQTEVYSTVYLEEHRYHSVRHLIDERDALIFDRVRPAVTEAGIKKGDSVDPAVIEQAIGDDAVQKLRDLTDGIISIVPQNLISFQKAFDLLRGVLTELYPKRTFIRCNFGINDEAAGQ